MIRLDDIALFVGVASLGSFSAAARAANLLPAQVSVGVKRLETALGVSLFVRNTRHVRLTRKGEQYLPHARDIVEALRTGRESVQGAVPGLAGDLCLGLPRDVGHGFLSPLLARFHRDNPGLRIRLAMGARGVVGQDVDALVGYGTCIEGGVLSETVIPAIERILVASPGYVARHGEPSSPDGLRCHACLVAGAGPEDTWTLTTGKRRADVSLRGAWCSDDGDLVRRWAVLGHGIALRPRVEVEEDLAEGRLVRVLDGTVGEPVCLAVSWQDGSGVTAAIRALTVFLRRVGAPAGRLMSAPGALVLSA
jgi:DNA-binding transcriptional LysR family regulator